LQVLIQIWFLLDGKWEIDANNYWYTNGTNYVDFEVLSYAMTQTENMGNLSITITDTSSLIVGDKIRLQDDTLSYEINYVNAITSPTTITLKNPLSRTYFFAKNPQIKVLRDAFANTHIHQIRDNEVEPISVPEYLVKGYPTQHSHRVIPLMSDVSSLANENNSVVSVGSGSIIYQSSDNGNTWKSVVDLNDYLEGSEEVVGSSTVTVNSNRLIVGATNGNIFAQTGKHSGVVKLRKPI